MKRKIYMIFVCTLFIITTISTINAKQGEAIDQITSFELIRTYETLPIPANIAMPKNIILKESMILSEPILKESDNYMTVDLTEATSQIYDIGAPALPVVTRVFTLPFGSTVHDIQVHFSDFNTLSLVKKVIPTPQPVLFNAMNKQHDVVEAPDFYKSGMMYPSTNYSCIRGSGLEGNDHVMFYVVHCYPVRYSSLYNTLYYSKQIDIELSYSQPSNLVLPSNVYDMVIITSEQFSPELQSFIDHKNNHGVKTTVKTIESIYGEYSGYDNQEKIKFFVKDAIETWGVSYVLLIGDVDRMPIRLSAVQWRMDGEIICSDVPTDLYYADVYDENASFCSWDSNGNGIYGEFLWDGNTIMLNDSVDLFADVNIGRIPCSNTKDLQIVLDKIMTYETQTFGQEWFTRVLLLGGDTFSNYGGNEGEIITEKNSNTMQSNGFEPIILRTSQQTFRPLNINREWTKGASFIGYSGHGYINGFGTYIPNSTKRINYYNLYLLGVFNTDKLPVIFFDACSTTTIDYRQLGSLSPCIAWSTLKKTNGGSIATIGATRKAWLGMYKDEFYGVGYLDIQFFKAYTPGTTPSAMLTSAKNDYLITRWKDCVSLEEITLLGDPSLKIGGYS